MADPILQQIEAIIQRDVNNRGLASDPKENLITACAGDFEKSCQSLAETARRWEGRPVILLTGFHIPQANAFETDGPPGTMFLARILVRLGLKVWVYSEPAGFEALQRASNALEPSGHLLFLFNLESDSLVRDGPLWAAWSTATHLIAIERAGPSHSRRSLWKQKRTALVPEEAFLAQAPREHWDHYHTMRGTIITEQMLPAHKLFDYAQQDLALTTIGIGDGGNEIGMGKIPWEIIAKNIPNGGLVACRVPTDYNIVCGVSNWGAYGLAAGVWHLRGKPFDPELFNPDAERTLWEEVLKEAVLVDGVTGQRTLTVDGLTWEDYIRPLREICDLLKNK